MNMTPAGNRVEFFGGLCSIKGCDLPELAAGFCNKHWRRLRKYGSPLWLAIPSGSYRGLPAEVRFFKRVIKTDACWNWQGGLDADGYGAFMGEILGTVFRRAHRFSWSFHNNRTIAPGMEILHSCDNRKCVNPDHLSLGTSADNQHDKWIKGRGWAHKGTSHWSTKLSEEQVREIRSSTETQKQLGMKYGLKQSTISCIVSRKSWKHVD